MLYNLMSTMLLRGNGGEMTEDDNMKGFINRQDLINEANKRADGWIRTGKQLPEHEQIVDIFFKGRRFTDCMFCDYKDSTPIHFYDERYDRIIELEDVEFWMPLPEAPK